MKTIEKKFKKTKIGYIPDDWSIVKLKEISNDIQQGFASGKRDENGIIQLRMNNITTDGKVILNSYLKIPIPENINKYLLKKGDIIFNNTNSVELIGKTGIFNEEIDFCTFSNHLTRIRINNSKANTLWVLYNFLNYWQKNYFQNICVKHVGQAGIRRKYIEDLEIPFPSLPEQQKIAEILSTVDEAIQQTDNAIQKTERLKRGLMQELLTKGIRHKRFKNVKGIGKIPEEWEIMKIGENKSIEIIMGQSPPSSTYNKENKGLAFFQGKNEFGEIYPVAEIFCTNPQKIAEKDDILISVRAPVGDVNIAPFKCCIGRGLAAIRIKNSEISQKFIFYYIRFSKHRFESISVGSTFKAIRKREIENFEIPFPNPFEQLKISEFISTMDKKIELEMIKKNKLTRIKNSLMNELLTGKKRVKVGE